MARKNSKKSSESSSGLSSNASREIVRTVRAILPGVEGIYLYGSIARGEGRADSDLDIAVMQLRPVEATEALRLRTELGVLFVRDVDILDLRRASTEIACQVVGSGKCLYGKDNRMRRPVRNQHHVDVCQLGVGTT